MRSFKRILIALLIPAFALAAGETLSPNMGMPIPGVGVTVGPDWADDINSSLNILDAHDHTPGNGVQITPAGLNINSDLAFNNTNISLPRSTRYTSQSAALAGANDVSSVYVVSGDLYFNDRLGNQIRITQGGAVSGSAGTITGLPSGTASAAYSSGSGTFVFQQATSTAANMDIGTLILRYPGSYPSPSGNYIAFEAPSSLATAYAFVLPGTLPAANQSFLTFSTGGAGSYISPDNSTLDVSSTQLEIKAGGVGTTQLASQAVTQAKKEIRSVPVSSGGAGTVVQSNSSGNFFTTNTSGVNVTNLGVTLTTLGSPVRVMVIPDGSGTVGNEATITTTNGGYFLFTRDGIVISQNYIPGNMYLPPSSLQTMDVSVNAGVHTYRLQAKSSAGAVVAVTNCILLVWEM